MIRLNHPQQLRLEARTREHDLAHIGAAVAEALQHEGVLEPALILRTWQRAQACGLSHALSMGRYLALSLVFGEAFERQPGHGWAQQILEGPAAEATKAYQLGRQAVEAIQHGSKPPGLAPQALLQAMVQIDERLGPCGSVGSLGPRIPLSVGCACDVLMLQIDRLHEGRASPQLQYRHRGGAWHREPSGGPPPRWSSTADLPLPRRLHLPGAASAAEGSTLRLRTRMLGTCAADQHPAIRHGSSAGVELRRGVQGLDWACPLPVVDLPEGLAVAREPLLQALSVESCGLRERGHAWGRQSTWLALYPGAQRLLAWRREAPPALAWPRAANLPEGRPGASLRRITLETDGEPDDTGHWQRGLALLDEQLQQGLARLFNEWEQVEGMSSARLHARPEALVGEAGMTWGYRSTEAAWGAPPELHVAGHLDLCACQLALALSGTVRLGDTRTALQLRIDGRADWRLDWEAGEEASSPTPQLEFRLPLTLSAEADAVPRAVLAQWSWAGEPPALLGRTGLRERQEGAGLEWYFEAVLEPVTLRVSQTDPWTGRLEQQLDLMPGVSLVEWSWT